MFLLPESFFFVFSCHQRDMAGISRKPAITLSSRGGKCCSLVGSPHQPVLGSAMGWSHVSTMQHHRAVVLTLPVAIGGFMALMSWLPGA